MADIKIIKRTKRTRSKEICLPMQCTVCSKHSLLPKEINFTPHILLLYKPTTIVIAPKSPQEGRLHIALIMYSHHIFDSARRFFCVVERDSRCVVMEDVILDRAMEDIASDKPKVSIYGRSAAAEERPRFTRIVWQSRVGVLQEGDGYYYRTGQFKHNLHLKGTETGKELTYGSSGWSTATAPHKREKPFVH